MSLLARMARLAEEGTPFALATVTWRRGPSSGKEGAKAIIHPDGRVEGWLGGACALPTVVREALGAIGDGIPRLLVLGEPDHRPGVVAVPMACSSEGAMEVYVDPILPPTHLHIVGSSPMTASLASLAGVLGWRVTVMDDPVMTGVTEATFVLVATQGRYDELALEAALQTTAPYIGLVASSKRASSVLEWLRQRGMGEEGLARVRAPAGLDLGATYHEEIAVAVLAELVGIRAASTKVEVTMPETAIDPVCNMTVDVETARFKSEYEAKTYYFCAPGCQKAFEADPESYLG